jgi:hypothetical protein
MNDYEECEVAKAEGVYLAGKKYLAPDCVDFKYEYLNIRMEFDRWETFAYKDLDVLGIKLIRKKKLEPLKFIAELVVDKEFFESNGSQYCNRKCVLIPNIDLSVLPEGTEFRCVEVIDGSG